MTVGLQQLKHIVVLMMENRSFDHMLGYMKASDSRIDGLTGQESNPDTTGSDVRVQADAEYQGQLQPDPGHHFEDTNTQIYGNPEGQTSGPTMQGFIKSYYQKRADVEHSRKIMKCFKPERLPVITTLAHKYAVCDRWFSSLPGPTLPNRAFAHFGTSFGILDMNPLYTAHGEDAIYMRMLRGGRSARIYYFDEKSATLGMTFLLMDQPQVFGTYEQFKSDCAAGTLPDYSFIEPNYSDHSGTDGMLVASDQHPDHNMFAGEAFIADVYERIRSNQELWLNTLLLIVYDEHGGTYDHVEPPAIPPHGYTDATTGFRFDRLGVRVPAVLISPWIPAGTVIKDMFEHASIPATVTQQFIGDPATNSRSEREQKARTFLNFLTLPAARTDRIRFQLRSGPLGLAAAAGADTVSLGTAAARAKPVAEPSRRISQLLLDHVRQLHALEDRLPPDKQTHVDISTIRTEGDASEYIAMVMARLRKR